MSTLFDFRGKVSIVTGGNCGIGRAIAMGLAEHGSEIVIAARNEKKTEHVVTSRRRKKCWRHGLDTKSWPARVDPSRIFTHQDPSGFDEHSSQIRFAGGNLERFFQG